MEGEASDELTVGQFAASPLVSLGGTFSWLESQLLLGDSVDMPPPLGTSGGQRRAKSP